jgi:hypothetical protein
MKSKYTVIGLLFLFGFVWTAKNLERCKKDKRIEKSTKEACMSATNELFGKTIDSLKACDCVIPAFYNFLQSNPKDVEKYNNSGLSELDQSKKDKFASLYQVCLLENIVDTNAKLAFTPQVQEQFRLKLRDTIALQFGQLSETRINNICDCLVKTLNNKITVKQYLTVTFSETDTLYDALKSCINPIK